jgi:tetratricopeptide (TPR) repeat protein
MVNTLHLRRQDAYRVLSDRARRAAYDEELRGLRARAGGPSDRGRAAHRSIAEGERLLALGEVEAAMLVLLATVREHPRSAGGHRALALALARHPRMARAAERHFLQALELDAGDFELRYQLALYYQKVGLPLRARTQLEAVVRAEPKHRAARRALAALLTPELTRRTPGSGR